MMAFITQQVSHSNDTLSEAKATGRPAQPGFRHSPFPCISQGIWVASLDDSGAAALTPVSHPGSMLEDEREKAAMGVGWGGDCLS